jgi:hypothetical protein
VIGILSRELKSSQVARTYSRYKRAHKWPENKIELTELTRCLGTFSRELKSSQVARNYSRHKRAHK